jgi:thymidine kinase/deoxynucleoside kinase
MSLSKKRPQERSNDVVPKSPKHVAESVPRLHALPPRVHASKSIAQEKSERKGSWLKMQSIEDLVGEFELGSLKGIVVEVEGNIGSGKSTLTGMLKNWIDSKLGAEHVSCFGEKVNNAFLKAFYANPKRFSFAFQMYMLTTRLYQMEESYRQARSEKRLCFLDRGAVGDTLFALLNHQLGSMDHGEMEIYRSVCRERLPASISDQVDMLIYLDVDPNECYRRMTMLRKRDSESTVPLAYLEEVDTCYFHLLMDWLGERKGTFHEMNIGTAPPALVLRWDRFGNVDQVASKILALRSGKRPTLSVRFQVEKPDARLTLDTAEEMEDYHQTLSQTGQLGLPLTLPEKVFVVAPMASASASKPAVLPSAPSAVEDADAEKPSSPLSPDSPLEPVAEPEAEPEAEPMLLEAESEAPASKPKPEIKHGREAKTLLAVNWDLKHTNAFKRVVMYYLSECVPIVYYGRSVVAEDGLKDASPKRVSVPE